MEERFDRKMEEKKTSKIRTVRDLKVYRKAFDSAMEIFAMLNAMEKKADTFCRP